MFRIRRLADSALRHLPRIARWIVTHDPARSAWCLFADVVATLLQTAAMFSLLYLITDYEAVIAEAQVLTGVGQFSNFALLGVGWTAIFLILVIAGLSSYSSRRAAVQIARAYEQHFIGRVIRSLGDDMNAGKELDVEALKTFLARGPHYLGRLALEMHLKFIPVLTCAVSVLAMVYLNWKVTTLVALMLVTALPVFVLLNRRATESSKGIVKYAKSHAKRKAELVNLLVVGTPITLDSDSLGVDANYLDSYELRLAINFTSVLYSRMVAAVVIFTALLPWLYLVQTQEATITQVGVYFLFLVYFFNGLQGAYALITKFYIFFPFVQPATQKNAFTK